ncbi:MAG TPA: hypothetical protein DCM68_05115 [Verrucomicrobia bacterium]|nr:hypothetical protein [Verrucomicrobiota bacterium]
MLASIIGQMDAMLEPADFGDKQWSADWQYTSDFIKSGGEVEWRNPGGDGAERKAFVRARDALDDAGLVIVAGGGRRVALTPEGDAQARRACGLPVLADALCGLDWLADPGHAPLKWRMHDQRTFISESSMLGSDPAPAVSQGQARMAGETASRLTNAVLPLLAAGLVEWRVWRFGSGLFLFRPTAEGNALAAKRIADGSAVPGKWPKFVRRSAMKIGAKTADACEAYMTAWEGAYRARRDAPPLWPNVCAHLDPIDPPPKVQAQGEGQTISGDCRRGKAEACASVQDEQTEGRETPAEGTP